MRNLAEDHCTTADSEGLLVFTILLKEIFALSAHPLRQPLLQMRILNKLAKISVQGA